MSRGAGDGIGVRIVKENCGRFLDQKFLEIGINDFTGVLLHGSPAVFEKLIDAGVFEAVIRPLGGDRFEFEVEGEGFNLGAIANPVNVSLTIGNDGGSIGVLAEISP